VENIVRSRRALVTGGGGFIGHHLVRRLLADGYEVSVLDNFATGRRERLEGLDVSVVEGDLRSYERAHTAVQGADVVFHLGALPSVPRSVQDPLTTGAVNVEGTLNVLLASRDGGVRRVVFASSSSVYGANEVLPKTEEDQPLPVSPTADPVFESARPGEVRSSHGNRDRAAAMLGWEPRWDLREALEASIEGLVGSTIG